MKAMKQSREFEQQHLRQVRRLWKELLAQKIVSIILFWFMYICLLYFLHWNTVFYLFYLLNFIFYFFLCFVLWLVILSNSFYNLFLYFLPSSPFPSPHFLFLCNPSGCDISSNKEKRRNSSSHSCKHSL